MMIKRLWHGWTTRENADRYEALLRSEILPAIATRVPGGYRGAELFRRGLGDEIEFLTILSFDSIADIRAFSGADYEVAVVPPKARQLLKRFDERASHYSAVPL